LRSNILHFERGTFVHRLILAMMREEGYAVRDCSLLLESTDSLIHSLYQEAIHFCGQVASFQCHSFSPEARRPPACSPLAPTSPAGNDP
jgi:hypothetical protein